MGCGIAVGPPRQSHGRGFVFLQTEYVRLYSLPPVESKRRTPDGHIITCK